MAKKISLEEPDHWIEMAFRNSGRELLPSHAGAGLTIQALDPGIVQGRLATDGGTPRNRESGRIRIGSQSKNCPSEPHKKL
jgi:hypothetical protein